VCVFLFSKSNIFNFDYYFLHKIATYVTSKYYRFNNKIATYVGWPVVLVLVVHDSLKLHGGKVDGEPWLNS
jgi:hypothetical protein